MAGDARSVDARELIGRLGVPADESAGTGHGSRRSRRAPRHIAFTDTAKAALERALRDALQLSDGSEPVLLGVVAVDRDVNAALAAHGVTYAALLARVGDA